MLLLAPATADVRGGPRVHVFVARDGATDPIVLTLCGLALFLLFAERRAWAGLVSRWASDRV